MNRKATILIISFLATPPSLVALGAASADAPQDELMLLNTFADGQIGGIPVRGAEDVLAREDTATGTRLTIRGLDGATLAYDFRVRLLTSRVVEKAEAEKVFDAYLLAAALAPTIPALRSSGMSTFADVDTGWSCTQNSNNQDIYCARTTAENTCCVHHWMKVNPEAATDTYYLEACDDGATGCPSSPLDTYIHTQGSTYYLNYVCKPYTVPHWWDPLDVWTRTVKKDGANYASGTYEESTRITLSAAVGGSSWSC